MGMLFQSQQWRWFRSVTNASDASSSSRVHHSESDTHLYESTKHSAVIAWSTGWLAHREALESPTQRANLPCGRDGHALVSLSAISIGLWPCISYCDNNAEGPRDVWMSRLWRANEWVNQDLESTVRGCLTFTTNVCFNLPWFSVFFPWRVLKLSVNHNF